MTASSKQVDGTVLTGTLATWSPETIQLSVGSDDRMAEVPVARIEVLETIQRHNYPKYIPITVAVTSIVGAVIAGSAWERRCTFLCITSFQTENRREAVALGFFAGASVGLPLGALIGLTTTDERWNPVSLPTPVSSGLSIRPVIGSRVGFAGSIRVGGF